MMNKKGALVLRDMIFMMMMVSAIFVLCGIFVSDISLKYENTNMTSEWGLTGTTDLASSTFYSVGEDVRETGNALGEEATGIYALLKGAGQVLDGIGKALYMVLTAPNTVATLVSSTLEDTGVNSTVADIINYLILIVLWAVVIFSISSAFLRGGKL